MEAINGHLQLQLWWPTYISDTRYQIIVCIYIDTLKYQAYTMSVFQDPVSVPESVCAVDGPGSNYSTSCNSDNYDSVQSKLETTVMFSLSSNAINIWPLKRGLPFTLAPAQKLFLWCNFLHDACCTMQSHRWENFRMQPLQNIWWQIYTQMHAFVIQFWHRCTQYSERERAYTHFTFQGSIKIKVDIDSWCEVWKFV